MFLLYLLLSVGVVMGQDDDAPYVDFPGFYHSSNDIDIEVSEVARNCPGMRVVTREPSPTID